MNHPSLASLATPDTFDSENAMLGEERSFPRIPTKFLALYSDPLGFFREDWVMNLSRGGMFVHSENPCAQGTVIEFILMLPETTDEITVQGYVTHACVNGTLETRGMGVMFTTVEPIHKSFLGNYLEHLEEGYETGRRSAPRIKTPPCRLHLTTEGSQHRAVLENLSHNGLFFRIKTPLSLFERITASLTHPETDFSIELTGEVVHLRKISEDPLEWGAGIRFLDLEPQTVQRVRELIGEILLKQNPGTPS